VPAIKSLLVRARIGLVEAAEARDADCREIRVDLMDAYDRGVKASSRARRHMRSCDGCTEYRTALRGMRRSFAALTPAGAGPLAMVGAKLLGLGGAGGGAAAGSSAVGGGAAAAGGVAACKVAAVVCTAVVATGGAVEVTHLARKHDGPAERVAAKAAAAAPAAAPARTLAAPTVHRGAVFARLILRTRLEDVPVRVDVPAAPVLADYAVIRAIDQPQQGKRDEENIVHLADERNHVREKIERNDRVDYGCREQCAFGLGHACIDHQAHAQRNHVR